MYFWLNMVSVQIGCTECWLKSSRTHVRTLNLLSFLVHTRGTSVILALVELLPSALFADHLLVARYEPCKKSSVSVCHNSNFDWLIIGGVANNYAGSGLKLYVRSHSLFNALRNFLAASSPHPRGLYTSSFKYFSTRFSS